MTARHAPTPPRRARGTTMLKNRTWSAPSRQRGMATLYIVLAVGLAVSVTVAASFYALRGDQQRQITTHSVTAAQAAAWRGVEVLRRYLLEVDQATLASWADGSGGLTLPAGVSGMEPLGIADGDARLTSIAGSGSSFQIGALVTAQAGSGSTLTQATVEVLYDLTAGGSGGGGSPTCAVIPAAPMIFNGDLVIRGGSLSVSNASGFEQIAVTGNIDLSSASSARISGCAKGNVTLSGGGIVAGGHLHAQGDITVSNMSPPDNTTLWGRNVTVNQYGGNYNAIQGGAYTANVFGDGRLIGTTEVGGQLLAGSVSGGLPWTVGTVVPATAGRITITLTSGDTWLLDLSKGDIDAATGSFTPTSGAEHLAGQSTTALPTPLSFAATGIAGGRVGVTDATTRLMWGHTVVVAGWNGSYDVLYANGDLDMVSGRVGRLVGGRDVIARQASQWSNFPNIVSGTIANVLRYGNGQQVPAGTQAAPAGLRQQQTGTTPGLPGIPFCDTRVNRIDVSSYRAAANYIFEWVDNAPHLTIQNVRAANGTALDGTYNLATSDVRRLPANGERFLVCDWQDGGQDRGHCFRNKTSSGTAWSATGLTAFPRGVAWFDNAVSINGIQLGSNDGSRALINTLVARGNITLTTGSSDKDLTAPNFSTPGLLCSGAFRPTNLCDTTGANPQFASWEDSNGVTRRGLPVGNMAVVAEGLGSLGGWNIRGNVILGRELSNNANATVIHGSLTVGTNQSGSTTSISQGGAEVHVPTNEDQTYLPGICEAPTPTPGGPASASVRWSRYL